MSVGGVEIAPPAAERAVKAVEAALSRRRMPGAAGERGPHLRLVHGVLPADVPLAGHEGAVAGAAQRLGEGDAIVAEIALVLAAAEVADHLAHARLVRMEAGQQRGAGRAAARAVVELAETDAARGERVEVRGADLGAVAADVREAHVVGEDHDDVRPRHFALGAIGHRSSPFAGHKPPVHSASGPAARTRY
jgi:hypothetical protein